MFRFQAYLPVVCFSSICLISSWGLAQEFYESPMTYSQSIVYPEYSTQTYANQTPVSTSMSVPSISYDSLGVSTETYTGVEGVVMESPVYQQPTFEGTFVQGAMSEVPLVSPDYGYAGPGDMRYHLWNDHGSEMRSNGVSKSQLDSMSMATVQKWHNFFHGSEGRPQQ